MSAPLSHDTARRLLQIAILDANDIRDHLSNRSYTDLLASAFAATGIKPDKSPSEAMARAVMRRATLAAKAAGIFGDPRIPGEKILGVLRAAATAKRTKK